MLLQLLVSSENMAAPNRGQGRLLRGDLLSLCRVFGSARSHNRGEYMGVE